MEDIRFSAPWLFMMVGLPGCGKSTIAEQMANDHRVVHSSDKLREELLGDVNDQSKQEDVFAELHRRVFQDLNAGKDVIYDATNLNYKRRMQFLSELRRNVESVWAVCCVIPTPYLECQWRNANRDRVVPESVIDRMYRSFDPPMYAEGWDEIWIRGGKDSKSIGEDRMNLIRSMSTVEHDNPHHTLSVGQHSILAYFYTLTMLGEEENGVLAQAALLHDIGKPFTKTFCNHRGEPSEIAHFYDHEHVSAYDSYRYSSGTMDERTEIATLIRWHMHPYTVNRSDNPTKTENKIKNLLGADTYQKIMLLHQADEAAH